MKFNPIISPCKDCEFRKVLCHCNCDRYRQYKADIDEYYKNTEGEHIYKSYVADKTIKAAEINRKRKKNRKGL